MRPSVYLRYLLLVNEFSFAVMSFRTNVRNLLFAMHIRRKKQISRLRCASLEMTVFGTLSSILLLILLSLLCCPVFACDRGTWPSGTLTVSANPAAGVPITFRASADDWDSSDPESIEDKIASIELDYDDGTNDTVITNCLHPTDIIFTHTYVAAGTYNVKMYVTDAGQQAWNVPCFVDGRTLIDNHYPKLGYTLNVTFGKIEYTYDSNGNRQTMTDPHGTTTYHYDVLNRLTRVDEPDGKYITYQYDNKGNRTQMAIHLDSQTVHTTNYDYYDNCRLYHVYDQLNNGTTTYTYQPNGLVDTVTYPNSTKTINHYDTGGRNWPIEIDNVKSDGTTVIAKCDYHYDPTSWGNNGTRTSVDENILKPDGTRIISTVAYQYDDLYRLTDENRTGSPAYHYVYGYDFAGNRTSWQVVGGTTTNYTYDEANKLTAISGTGQSATYDDKGNMVFEPLANSAVTRTYTWDYLNHLAQVQIQQSGTTISTVNYIYDGNGMRVTSTPQGGTATNYLLDGRDIAEEMMGSVVTSYVGQGLISEVVSGVRTVYHADGIGSTRAMTDANQAVQVAEVYDAYGNVSATYGSGSGFGYAGKVRYYADSNTAGLYYLKARYYDPTTARFLSRDPIGYRGGTDLYEYVTDNPVTRVDPYGLMSASVDPNWPAITRPSPPYRPCMPYWPCMGMCMSAGIGVAVSPCLLCSLLGPPLAAPCAALCGLGGGAVLGFACNHYCSEQIGPPPGWISGLPVTSPDPNERIPGLGGEPVPTIGLLPGNGGVRPPPY